MNLPECYEIVGIEAEGLTKSGSVSEDICASVAGPEPQIEGSIGRLTPAPKAGAKGMHDDSRLTHGPTGKKGHFMLGVERESGHLGQQASSTHPERYWNLSQTGIARWIGSSVVVLATKSSL
jgi:hypothetical protein